MDIKSLETSIVYCMWCNWCWHRRKNYMMTYYMKKYFFKEDETPSNADFCILVNGDSMEPMLKQGTYAFIK